MTDIHWVFCKNSATQEETEISSKNQQLLDELNKPIIKKIEKLKLYSSFKDNIWCADLDDM